MTQHDNLFTRGGESNARTAEALLSNLDNWEMKTGAKGATTESDLSMDVLRTLEFDFLNFEDLHPANWKLDNPELLVEARLDASTLQVWVTPGLAKNTRNADNEWSFAEFKKFGKPGRYQPWLKVAEISMDMPDSSARAIHRLMAYQCYKFVLGHLGGAFRCKHHTALFEFAQDHQLMTRRFPLANNLVEIDEESLAAQEPAFWHPHIFTLAQQLALDPRELLEVYRKDFKRLSPELWSAAWSGYIGKMTVHRRKPVLMAIDTEVLHVLAIADNPERFPPLVAHNAPDAAKALSDLLSQHSAEGLLKAVAQHYRLSSGEAKKAVAAFLPDTFTALPRTVAEMKAQIEQSASAGTPGSAKLHQELRRQLFEQCRKVFEDFPGRWDVSLRNAVKLVGQDWAQQHLPEMLHWADEVDAQHRKPKFGAVGRAAAAKRYAK